MPLPLAGIRVVATLPPHPWLRGTDFNFAVEMVEELRALGATVFELDVGGFVVRNEHYTREAIAALRSFHPDVVLSLPHAGYALLCRTADLRNIFKDVLQIPTVMLWEHGLLQLPKVCLDPLPQSPSASLPGAIERMREMLVHPLYHHYSPDTGHIAALERLGVFRRGEVRSFLQPAYPNFVRHGYGVAPGGAFRTRLAFAGNLETAPSGNLPCRQHDGLSGIGQRVLARKQDRLTEPLWNLLNDEIQAVGDEDRKRLALEPDSTFFWRFVYDEIEIAGNTAVPLGVLDGLTREYEFYGDSTGLAKRDNVTFRKSLDYFTELPLLFMNSDLIVDIVNLGYNTGTSAKIMGCLACGGLVLFDYKLDFREAMGEISEEIMYRSVPQLNALIDRYLANPKRRRDLARYLQFHALNDFSFASLCQRILVTEPTWRN